MCPRCRSVEISRSHRHGGVEHRLLRAIGVCPFRCLNCDVRFFAFSDFDEERLQINKARRALSLQESNMAGIDWRDLYPFTH